MTQQLETGLTTEVKGRSLRAGELATTLRGKSSPRWKTTPLKRGLDMR